MGMEVMICKSYISYEFGSLTMMMMAILMTKIMTMTIVTPSMGDPLWQHSTPPKAL